MRLLISELNVIRLKPFIHSLKTIGGVPASLTAEAAKQALRMQSNYLFHDISFAGLSKGW
jgi:hypothetical protein